MPDVAGPYITGWSALSPFGIGRSALVEGLAGGRTGPQTAPGKGTGPRRSGFFIDAFDPVALLGPKGIRTLDRLTLMSIATSGMLLAEHAAVRSRRGSVGLVLGTSTGSIASIVDFTRDTFTQDKPYLVNPAAFPNTVMNGAAGHTAIWHSLRGLNSTVSAGQVTALAALRYATRMIRRGYADTIIVGAVEELSEPVVRATELLRAQGAGDGVPDGEGCVMFLLQGAGAVRGSERDVLAEVVDFAFAVSSLDDSAAARAHVLAAAIRTLLSRNGVDPGQVARISLAQAGDPVNDAAERAAVAQAFGDAAAQQIVVSRQVGNCFSALGAFQTAAVLAAAEADAKDRRSPALITSLGSDGAVTCALIRS